MTYKEAKRILNSHDIKDQDGMYQAQQTVWNYEHCEHESLLQRAFDNYIHNQRSAMPVTKGV